MTEEYLYYEFQEVHSIQRYLDDLWMDVVKLTIETQSQNSSPWILAEELEFGYDGCNVDNWPGNHGSSALHLSGDSTRNIPCEVSATESTGGTNDPIPLWTKDGSSPRISPSNTEGEGA